MRKIYSIVLMAVGLLIGTQGWANLPQRPTPPMEPKEKVMLADLPAPVEGLAESLALSPADAPIAKAAPRKAASEDDGYFAQIVGGGTHNGQKFASLKDAIATADAGEEVLLLQNITTTTPSSIAAGYDTYYINISKNITLNLNNHSIEDGFTGVLYTIRCEGAEVTIKDGTIWMASNSYDNNCTYGILVVSGKVTLDNINIYDWNNSYYPCYGVYNSEGSVTIKNGNYSAGGNYAVYNAGTMLIENGTFGYHVYCNGGYLTITGGNFNYSVNGYYSDDVTIVGGTYKSNYLSTIKYWVGEYEGVQYGFKDNGNSTYTVVESTCMVDEDAYKTAFESLADAVAYQYVPSYYSSITLYKNITGMTNINKDVTINLNGHTGGTLNAVDDATVWVNGVTTSGTTLSHDATSHIYLPEGTYSFDPSAYVAPGYRVVDNGDQTYTISMYKILIGSDGYETLTAAAAAVQDGETIVIKAGFDMEEGVDINKNCTIDVQCSGTSNYIKGNMDGSDSYMLKIESGKTVTLTAANYGTFAKTKAIGSIVVVEDGANLILDNSVYLMSTDYTSYENICSVKTFGGSITLQGSPEPNRGIEVDAAGKTTNISINTTYSPSSVIDLVANSDVNVSINGRTKLCLAAEEGVNVVIDANSTSSSSTYSQIGTGSRTNYTFAGSLSLKNGYYYIAKQIISGSLTLDNAKMALANNSQILGTVAFNNTNVITNNSTGAIMGEMAYNQAVAANVIQMSSASYMFVLSQMNPNLYKVCYGAPVQVTNNGAIEYYANLPLALEQAMQGETITLLKGLSFPQTEYEKNVIMDKDVTLDANGQKLSGQFIIKISRGTLENELIFDDSNPRLTISGGRIKGEITKYDYASDEQITLIGGMYDHQYPQYLASGYRYFEEQITEDNTQKTVYTIIKETDVIAVVNGKEFTSIDAAIAEANTSGEEIRMVNDYTGDVTFTTAVTLNMGSFRIEGTVTADGAKVIVNGNGTIDHLAETNAGELSIIRAYTLDNPTNFLAEGSTFEQTDEVYRVYPENVAKMVVGGQETFYSTVVAAFAALPENSTPATVTLLADEYMEYVGQPNSIAQYHNVTLDLNGHVIYGTNNYGTASSAVVVNNGSLTVKDGSAAQTGAIYNSHTNPEDWKSMGKEYPAYAYNIFSNYGTLTIESGYFESAVEPSPEAKSTGYACYVVDNYSGGTLIVNGGTLYNYNTQAIRQFCNNPELMNEAIINGGEVIGYQGVWLQLPSGASAAAPKASFTMNGGKLSDPWGHTAFYDYSYGQHHDNITITINGGEINGRVFLYTSGNGENLSITGGTFTFDPVVKWQTITSKNGGKLANSITGGKFLSVYPNDDETSMDEFEYYVAESSCVTHQIDGDKHWKVVDACTQEVAIVTGETNAANLADAEGNPIELTETTNLEIKTQSDGDAEVVFTEDASVNEIYVTTDDGKGEAQIVVKDGATLNVGNGGIVSENDVLTTVLVESGGTLIIGTGGIDQKGEATPIEIEASEANGTGTLIFSPNTSTQDTKKYAEVDLYTYCKKVGDKYYWQQFGIPVTGLDNSKVERDPNEISYVFEWDYATYGWSQLNNWNQLDEPFACYDVTNVSPDGGVVYTFKGDLIGNQNIQLTLPHSDYCVMGNSYTAPIDVTALFEQIDKEMTGGVIERTVYKYDAKAGYYVYTNELEQTLAKLGITNAAFTDIKPMEGFLLNLQNGNTAGVMLNYANAVFKPATTTTVSSAPARTASTADLTIAKIMVKSDNYTDAMTLIEGEEFSSDIENGKDAYKYINQEGINLYAFNNNDKLAMVASDNIEGTNIAFQSSNDVNYTLTFSNVINSDYELLDMQTNIRTPMVEGASYSFTAAPNTLNPARFMVVAPIPAMPTDAEQVKESNNVKGVYTILGQYLCEAENWSELPKGIYIVNGVKIVK